jgi:hypothetical protein
MSHAKVVIKCSRCDTTEHTYTRSRLRQGRTRCCGVMFTSQQIQEALTKLTKLEARRSTRKAEIVLLGKRPFIDARPTRHLGPIVGEIGRDKKAG